jgi:hypothetical protein
MHANVQRLMARCAALGVVGFWEAEAAGAAAGVSMVPPQPSRG